MIRYLVFGTAMLASACTDPALNFRQNTVNSVIEAGETHVAVLSVADWNSIKGRLKPGFQIDAATALTEALPRISAYEEKLLNAFAAKLQFQPPQTGSTITQTTDLATRETTGTQTNEVKPGGAPDASSSATDTSKKTTTAAAISKEDRDRAVGDDDPMLKYQAANAIYQYVQLLDSMVDNVPKIESYTPYLVTFQITSFPYARHQPYDVYLDMSFFPQVNRGTGVPQPLVPVRMRTPIVVPVLITDNLQGQTVSRTAELITQLDAAAQALSGGFFASLGLSVNNQRSAAVFGTDYTATFTVGRTSENGLTAVLGAAPNPVSEFAMIRRTHNVSVIIFVPDEIAAAAAQEAFVQGALHRRIGVTMTTSLRRPDKPGSVLKPLVSLKKQGSTARAIKRLKEMGLEAAFAGNCNMETAVRQLLQYVPVSDYPGYLRALAQICSNFGYPEGLYHVLSDIYGSSPGFRSTTIHLPSVKS